LTSADSRGLTWIDIRVSTDVWDEPRIEALLEELRNDVAQAKTFGLWAIAEQGVSAALAACAEAERLLSTLGDCSTKCWTRAIGSAWGVEVVRGRTFQVDHPAAQGGRELRLQLGGSSARRVSHRPRRIGVNGHREH